MGRSTVEAPLNCVTLCLKFAPLWDRERNYDCPLRVDVTTEGEYVQELNIVNTR